MGFPLLLLLVALTVHGISEGHPMSECWEPEHHPITSHQQVSSHVNVVTGDYIDESVDLVVAGCEPLAFHRFHNRNAPYDPRYVGWFINPECFALGNLNLPKYDYNRLKFNLNAFAAVGERDGSITSYEKEGSGFKFDPAKKAGFCHASQNGQHHPLNTTIEYWVGKVNSQDSDCFSFDGMITDGSGTKRLFTSGEYGWHKFKDVTIQIYLRSLQSTHL